MATGSTETLKACRNNNAQIPLPQLVVSLLSNKPTARCTAIS